MNFVSGIPIEFWRKVGVEVGEDLTFTKADKERLAWRRLRRAISRFMRLGFAPRFIDIPERGGREHYGFFGVCNSTSSRAHRRNAARFAYRDRPRMLRRSISDETRNMDVYFAKEAA